MTKKADRKKYRDYWMMRGKDIYGAVYLPDPVTGKLKRKEKKCATKTEANAWAMSMLGGGANGGRVEHDPGRPTTFAEVATWYKEYHLFPPVIENGVRVDGMKGWATSRSKLDFITKHFGGVAENAFTPEQLKDPYNIVRHSGGRLIKDINEIELKMYSRWRRSQSRWEHGDRNGITQRTVNDDFALIRAMMIAGKERYPDIKVPSFKNVMVKQAEKERDRVLSFEEEGLLLAQCFDGEETVTVKRAGRMHTQRVRVDRAHVGDIITVAMHTAMRLGEILKLDWGDVDLAQGEITVIAGNSKTGWKREVPITSAVRQVLESLEHRKGKVFRSNWKRGFILAVRRAGLENFRFHDLRHTATTRMIQSGTSHMEVMKITGHRQIKTFQRYMHITGPRVQDAGRRLESYHAEQMRAVEVSQSVM